MVGPPAAPRERRLENGRLTLNAREAGAGSGELAIFLHGITANAAVWDPVLAELGRSFRAISIDQRGHGYSDKPPTGYAGTDYARDVLSLVEALGGTPALLVGHSLGARNALVAAAERPELVSGVVAIDFTPFIEPPVLDALADRVRGGDRRFGSLAEITAYLGERYPRLPADAVRRRAAHGYREHDGGYAPLADPAAMAETVTGLRDDLEPAVRAVRRPVLLVRGSESRLVSRTAFARTLVVRPDFCRWEVPDTDHYVPEEAPADVSAAIRDFAETVS